MKRTLTILTILCFVLQVEAQEFSDQVQRFITVSDSEFAITNVNVIDGTGSPIKTNQTLII